MNILKKYLDKYGQIQLENRNVKEQEKMVEEAKKALEQAEKNEPPAKAKDYPPQYLNGQIVLEEKKGSYFFRYCLFNMFIFK